MMQSLHVLRFALRGSLLPLHLEQRLCRPVGASEQESEASTSPRHRTRCARRCLLQLRCCTPLPLCNTLFQRLALLSDTSLVQSAFGRAFSLRSPLRARDILSSASIPHCGALALFAWRQSGFIANGTRRLTFFATPSTADNGTAVRAVIGRGRNRRLCQLPDLCTSTTPHSLRSYGVCSVARSLSCYHFVTNSFLQAAPKPTYAPTAFVLSSARSVLRTSIADNNTSIGCIDYSR